MRKPRGRPIPTNPGRPRGSKNKVTQIDEELAEGQAEQLVRKVLRLAQAGDVSCLRMVLERIWPPRKSPPINVTMPPTNSSQDVLDAIAATALGQGRLTPDEIMALPSVVGRSMCGWERMFEMRKKVRKPRGSYAVGYARPPTSAQYQPGQSGNPQGRPKGVRNASSMARDALERTVNVKVKRSWRKMTVRKAAYLRVAERAAAGDAKALDYLLSLESEERAPGSDHAQPLSANDIELLQGFFDRRRARVPQQMQPDAYQQQRRNTEKDKK